MDFKCHARWKFLLRQFGLSTLPRPPHVSAEQGLEAGGITLTHVDNSLAASVKS